MSGSAKLRSDASRLSRLDRGLHRLERCLALGSGLAVLLLIALAVVSVAGRHLFNQPLPGYVDWIEQLMPLIALLGLAYNRRLGADIRMDMLISRMKGRALWGIELVTVFLMLIVSILLLWGSWSHFGRSFDFAMPLWSRDSSMDIALPLWLTKLIVPVSFAFLCLRLLLQLVGYALALKLNPPEPVAVPLPETIVEKLRGAP